MPVFAMLVTEPSSALIPVEGGKAPVSMPAILPAGSEERWLCADWKEAQQLIRPIAGAELAVDELSGAGPDFRSPSR
jgi:putative SOS response-associated peptidase YedK